MLPPAVPVTLPRSQEDSGVFHTKRQLSPDPPMLVAVLSVVWNENALPGREDLDCDVRSELHRKGTS